MLAVILRLSKGKPYVWQPCFTLYKKARERRAACIYIHSMTGGHAALTPDIVARTLSQASVLLIDVDNFMKCYDSRVAPHVWDRMTRLEIDATYACPVQNKEREQFRPLALPRFLKHLKVVDRHQDARVVPDDGGNYEESKESKERRKRAIRSFFVHPLAWEDLSFLSPLPHGLLSLDCSGCARLKRLPILKNEAPCLAYLDCRGCRNLDLWFIRSNNLPKNVKVEYVTSIYIPLECWFDFPNNNRHMPSLINHSYEEDDEDVDLGRDEYDYDHGIDVNTLNEVMNIRAMIEPLD